MAGTTALVISAVSPSFAKEDSHRSRLGLTADEIEKA